MNATTSDGISSTEKMGIIFVVAVVLIIIVMVVVWWLFTRRIPDTAIIPVTPPRPSPSTPSLPSVTSGVTVVNVSSGKKDKDKDKSCDSDTLHDSDRSKESHASSESGKSCSSGDSDLSHTSDKSCSSGRSYTSSSQDIVYSSTSSETSSQTHKDKVSRKLVGIAKRTINTKSDDKETTEYGTVQHGTANPSEQVATYSVDRTPYESKTRSETGEVEVISLLTKTKETISCLDGCHINCMVADQVSGIIHVHMIGDRNTTGVYSLGKRGKWVMIARTDDVVVRNLYISNSSLVLVSDTLNYSVSNGKLLERRGHTFDKHSIDNVTVTVVETEDGDYGVHCDNNMEATIKSPSTARIYNDRVVYFSKKDGVLKGVKGMSSVNNIMSFDSDGYTLVYIKDAVAHRVTSTESPVTISQVDGTKVVILGDKLYCA